jgi:hypothetical protein
LLKNIKIVKFCSRVQGLCPAYGLRGGKFDRIGNFGVSYERFRGLTGKEHAVFPGSYIDLCQRLKEMPPKADNKNKTRGEKCTDDSFNPFK